jgi:hypothetical protein
MLHRMRTFVSLTDLELSELAMCARLGAKQCRADAEKAATPSVRDIHLGGAKFREELATRLEDERKRLLATAVVKPRR